MPEGEEQQKLATVIRQWNKNRRDLCEISQPDENLEFYGVMRFYFEDHVGGTVATKCVPVCSSSPTCEVIETLCKKFRPDLKMLTMSFSLYEVHGNTERKLDPHEKPLVIQLNWTPDDIEGRFVLKAESLEIKTLKGNCHKKEKGGMMQKFKRTLSGTDQKNEKNKDSKEEGLTGKQLDDSSICESDCEMKMRCAENTKQQEVNVMRSVNPHLSDQPGLPIRVQFSDKTEDVFLSAVINCTYSSTVHFKLSPAYILYAAGRFALLRHRSRSPTHLGQMHGVTVVANKMVAMMSGVVQDAGVGALTFWMANSSELLNFLKHDHDLCPLTQHAQLNLSQLVQKTYSSLSQCLQNELRKHLDTFLTDPEHYGLLPAGMDVVLNTLMNSMSLARRCRVNTNFTIQVFSKLFHFISAWLFNRLMSPEADTLGLRSHYWGAALRQRLMAIEAWAERQGLELAANCHLGHIIQATTLLTMNKYSMKQAADIQNTCFKLNSLQLQALLANYFYAADEPLIPPDLINAVVTAAEASADKLIQSDGWDIQLEERLDLRLPFLLPEGGYSCDTVRGIPAGFREFLEPICQKGICSLTSQPNSKGDWTVYFRKPTPSADSTFIATRNEPDIVTITLKKPQNSGMGVSIIAAKGAGQSNFGIYIKSIVKGGPAQMNGRLSTGDQLLRVNGQSLVGLSQERAAAIMKQTGPVMSLQVAKFGASYHGLWALLTGSTTERHAGDGNHINPNWKHGVVDGGKGKNDHMMKRNKQYQSNPNLANFAHGEKPAVRRNNMTAFSSVNHCADTFHREYSTLPTPKSLDYKKSESSQLQQTKLSVKPLEGQSSSNPLLMCQALSQGNFGLESGDPLLDKRQNSWDQQAKQTTNHDSSFPSRLSVSTHNISPDHCFTSKQEQGSRTSNVGVWRSPFSQQPVVDAVKKQPIRIDVPLTRAMKVQTNPLLATFQRSKSQTLNGNTPQNQAQNYSTPATKMVPSQQHRINKYQDKPAEPQVTFTPAKHVSFQNPPNKQKDSLDPAQQRNPDPWRREVQERVEKQRQLHAVEVLEQEAQGLQAKAKCTAEESYRLQKLSLDFQLEKRMQEIQQSRENEEEKDHNMMLTIQELNARLQNSRSFPDQTKLKDIVKPARTQLPKNEDMANPDLRKSAQSSI
ncbi:afadin-like isoform X2 [Antennarius striatus]|uniref:afadin-like isoform X2 n=1 Tax=Antennarius striatus TaxID=241820 RepID=UPI0035B1A797